MTDFVNALIGVFITVGCLISPASIFIKLGLHEFFMVSYGRIHLSREEYAELSCGSSCFMLSFGLFLFVPSVFSMIRALFESKNISETGAFAIGVILALYIIYTIYNVIKAGFRLRTYNKLHGYDKYKT